MNFEIDRKAAAIALTIMQAPLVATFVVFYYFIVTPTYSLQYSVALNGVFIVYILPIFLFFLTYFLFAFLWLNNLQANKLEYSLSNEILTAKRGVLFKQISSIPVKNITDIVMVQGPIQSFFNIWSVKIKTAGMGQRDSEVLLLGLKNPEIAKNEIIAAIENSNK